SVTPRSARLSAACTSPVMTPAPIRVELTEIATEVLFRVIVFGTVTGLGVAVPVIGTAKSEKVPVTPSHALVCVVSADELIAVNENTAAHATAAAAAATVARRANERVPRVPMAPSPYFQKLVAGGRTYPRSARERTSTFQWR